VEQHIATIVSVCSFFVACFSALFAWNAVKVTRTTNKMELIRRRFDVFNAVVTLHTRLSGWDRARTATTEITPEVESAFLDFNVAVAHAEVLFPEEAPIRALLDGIGRDASHIAIDRREHDRVKEMLSMASAKEQIALAQEKVDRANRFYLESLPKLKDALLPYVRYDQLGG
jgi:hypothetical protein